MIDSHDIHCPASAYELVALAASPVSLAEMKSYLKISSASEDTLIQSLIDTVTNWAEGYTGRQFRANQWELLLDYFPDRIDILKIPVDTIDSITHIVSGSPVAVSAATYYLKRLGYVNEVLVADGQNWPTNTDSREQAVTVAFTCKAYTLGLSQFKNAVMRFVTYLYENRGDCSCDDESAIASGAKAILDSIRIPRV